MVQHVDPVHLASRFIQENAHRPIGLREIAEAAHLSERGLQHAFKKQLGTAPIAYLRRVRLSRVHEELRSADPHGRTTVNEVARRWHFTHHSRFAALYVQTFGAYPAVTLHQQQQ
ncbi:MAG: helix-turn-helix transcriptional regulator [Herbiconiux sp.]|nr:helix-turn-helix transcriptional regulator [Herbiconiux sp.]